MTNNSKLSAWPSMLSPPFLGPAPSDDASNPLAQSLSSGMEFMKNLWGQMPSGVPGFVVPSVDLEELDKRIADLKAVEGWLELNANMLKATIQGLQVQRSTVATLKAMGQPGGGLNQMMHELQRSQAQASLAGSSATSAVPEFGHANWPMAAAKAAAGSAANRAAHPAATPAQSESAASPHQVSMPLHSGAPSEPEKKPSAKKAAAKARTGRRESVEPQSSDAVNSAAMASANIWMNFLKEQFSQIAGAATRSTEVASTAPVKAATASPAAARAAKGAKVRAGSKKQSKRRAAAKRVLAPRR